MNKLDFATDWSYYDWKIKTINCRLNKYPKSKKLLKRKSKYENLTAVISRPSFGVSLGGPPSGRE